jgi:hypothetical protein
MPVPIDTVKELVKRDVPLTVRWAHHIGPAVEALAGVLEEGEAGEGQAAVAALHFDGSDRLDAVCVVVRLPDRLLLALRDTELPADERVTAIPHSDLGDHEVRRRRGRGNRVAFSSGFSLTFHGRRGRRFAEALLAGLEAGRQAAGRPNVHA